MTIRKKKLLALFTWVAIIFAVDRLSDYYSFLSPLRPFGFSTYLIGVMMTKNYITNNETKEQKL
ncbi:MAG: hypothetical protein PWR19_2052 [Carnobacterium sp.]|uniref:hypothetical protein n=1 Tax=Carnobacterium sp. TaxID=48221 RepID=UPI00264700AB|nr:hypothetical protein [Carnobacterium sp.]MDN5373006.1 hypothetical protein [Carnobacterium sp.]